ncbi:hypothetical protein CDQ84_16265 [Clostridium thermosuccinogenes]|uniref:Uncharacterized protein n=1 Tax=Clostridium thermosuccinogenes TaxID=84032 RepID=A0A2K2F8J0_9CLOT|nr:hypothetical protein CDO33_07350 [Pseudoclostridium thermosuccinogenes]PNT95085.1 hypothetical protein CDQ85_16030 [Pseudoclostridium thermosuccinogenes]PNT95832.1 hypothetical protein CDQ84_16265 [Pseudoclostridium thermosuccinogenes]
MLLQENSTLFQGKVCFKDFKFASQGAVILRNPGRSFNSRRTGCSMTVSGKIQANNRRCLE